MAFPQVVAVAQGSPADQAGIAVGDELRRVNGVVPADVIEYRLLVDEAEVELELSSGGLERVVEISKAAGGPLGIEVSSAVFDRVRTCDNHCSFCFIYQLPRGMRRSLYVKDDDYRLSFLYGNFTTLTRFTELDLERVVSERLSPLYVSIHATDPEVRARLLRNRRGATSLRWLAHLLDAGIEVHGQLVICPGVNDGPVLHESLAGILESYPRLASAAAVPLGVSRYSNEPEMRPHTREEAVAVLEAVQEWQERFLAVTGRRLVHAADEYHLLAGRPFPPLAGYDGLPQLENGVGMAAEFAAAFAAGARAELAAAPAGAPAGAQPHPRPSELHPVELHPVELRPVDLHPVELRPADLRPAPGGHGRGGFFASVDGAPAAGYRAPRAEPGPHRGASLPLSPAGSGSPRPGGPVTVLTGRYGAAVLAPLLAAASYGEVEVLAVDNELFGGNIAVSGLLGGSDVARVLSGRATAPSRRYLLPDVCLSEGRFLDGLTLADLPLPVEVVPTDGASLRRALAPHGAGTTG